MKKFVLSFLVFLFVGSCGSLIVGTVHAETLSPAEAASVAQSLQVIQTELADLQNQAAAQRATPTAIVAPTVWRPRH